MQMIDFLKKFFTKGLEIHSSFLSYFPDFSKNNFQNKNPNFEKKNQNFIFSKIQIWKISEFWIGTKSLIPQPAKTPLNMLSELYYTKAAFVKAAGESRSL
jgi:hypothetical protein